MESAPHMEACHTTLQIPARTTADCPTTLQADVFATTRHGFSEPRTPFPTTEVPKGSRRRRPKAPTKDRSRHNRATVFPSAATHVSATGRCVSTNAGLQPHTRAPPSAIMSGSATHHVACHTVSLAPKVSASAPERLK